MRRAVGKQAEVINTLVVPDLVQPQGFSLFRHSQNGEGPMLPASAIGVELAKEPHKAELEFVSSRAAPSNAAEISLIQNGKGQGGASIGQQLAKTPLDAELAFVESRSTGTGSLENSSHFASSKEVSQGHSGSPLNGGAARSDSRNLLTSKLRGIFQKGRPREFWEAAAREPSMQQGEVEQQELNRLEGWRHIPLKESVGHTKTEVLVGAIAGVVFGLALHSLGIFKAC